MPSIGDVVSLFFSTLNKGAAHTTAMKLHGPNYAQEQEGLDVANMQNAIKMGDQLTASQRVRAADSAAAGQARSEFGVSPEVSEIEAAAQLPQRVAASGRQQATTAAEADLAATKALTDQRNRGLDPATMMALRQEMATALEGIKHENRLGEITQRAEEGARLRPEVGSYTPVLGPDGRLTYMNFKSGRSQEMPEGTRTPLNPGERGDQANFDLVIGDAERVANYLDDPNFAPKLEKYFGGPMGLKGTASRFGAELGMVEDPQVLDFMNTLQKLAPKQMFAEGGKQLTNTEKDLVTPYLPLLGQPTALMKNNVRMLIQSLGQIRQSRFGARPQPRNTVAPGTANDTDGSFDPEGGVVSDLPGGGWKDPGAAPAPNGKRKLRYNPATGDFE